MKSDLYKSYPFAESPIWKLQRDYFELAGALAWGYNQVPSYITSNPSIAMDYAQMVFAFFRDLHRQGRSHLPVHFLEMGGGSGQFAYYFLKALHHICADAPFPVPPCRYVLSDFAPSTLEFLTEHPRLQPYFESGHLVIAHLDAYAPHEASLYPSGQDLLSLFKDGPLIPIGNYFFDSIPQDLYRVRQYAFEQVQVEIGGNFMEEEQPDAILEKLELEFSYAPAPDNPYQNRQLDQLLADYAGKFEETHLLFPHTGLKLLQQLRNSTSHEMMLLSADKGEFSLPDLDRRYPPNPTRHGSFSLQVNYHALHSFCRLQQGLVLAPHQPSVNIQPHVMLFPGQGQSPDQFIEVQRIYRDEVGRFGPDNYFGLKKILEKYAPRMSWRELLSAIRFSRFDPRLFVQLEARLKTVAANLLLDESEDVIQEARIAYLQAAAQIWDMYYPLPQGGQLGADDALGEGIAQIFDLFEMEKEAQQIREADQQVRSYF